MNSDAGGVAERWSNRNEEPVPWQSLRPLQGRILNLFALVTGGLADARPRANLCDPSGVESSICSHSVPAVSLAFDRPGLS
jgi:hypothetical protein